jgi:hypothetical protein
MMPVPQRVSAIQRGWSRWPQLLWPLGFLSLVLAAPTHSQSLGDIARQERQRKQEQQPSTLHVYDNEDLEGAEILLPEDRERVRASKQEATLAARKPTLESAGSELETDDVSLGDIARHYPAVATHRQKPASRSRSPQPTSSASVLAYPNISRQSMHRLSSLTLHQYSDIQNAPPGETTSCEEISGSRCIHLQSGDTLWKLAHRYLGRGKYWLLLAANNPQLGDPSRLKAGVWVHLPSERPNNSPRRHVRAAPREALWKFTQVQFGHSEAWNCVEQANPQLQNSRSRRIILVSAQWNQ